MSEQINYHPLVEKARRELWGQTGLVRQEDWNEWLTLESRDQARYLGARVNCPVVETLADDLRFGPEYQIQRYGNVAGFFGLVRERLNEQGAAFAEKFGAEVDLSLWGGIRKHDTGWVPEERKMAVSGAETYHGFVLPRQIIDIRNTADSSEEAFRVVDTALGLMADARDLNAAVARLVRMSRLSEIDEKSARERVFPQDWREELPDEYVLPFFKAVEELL